MNGGSAVTEAVLRCEARGAATASGRVMPRSRRLVRVCRTVVMIVDPPGEPNARNGLPCRSTMVGDIDERGRLPGWIRFGSAASYTAEKSVSSLFSRKPRPGTVIPLPPVCSMVSVYETTLPHLSAATRCVVDRPSVSGPSLVALVPPQPPYWPSGTPGLSGFTAALAGSIRQERSAPKPRDNSSLVGTSTYAGSPTYAPRSAKARAD